MKFVAVSGSGFSEDALERDYKASREIGVLRIGEDVLYFRVRRRVYFVPYGEIRRYYRRVYMVPARLCCGRGNIDVENLVIEGEKGELAQIELPGSRAAKELMLILKEKMPFVPSVCPGKEKEKNPLEGLSHA